MKSSATLASRFREVLLNGTWVANTNYKQQLTGLPWEMATAKVGALNTISDLAQHIHYYIKGVQNVFEGGSLDIKDKFSFTFPPLPSQMEWTLFLDLLWKDAEAFAASVEQLPDEQLNEVFAAEKYGTYLRNIEGMIEHCYYHLGQIVLIKKLLSGSPK